MSSIQTYIFQVISSYLAFYLTDLCSFWGLNLVHLRLRVKVTDGKKNNLKEDLFILIVFIIWRISFVSSLVTKNLLPVSFKVANPRIFQVLLQFLRSAY